MACTDAKGATRTPHDASMGRAAADAGGVTAAAAAAVTATAAAAAATSGCKPYAWAEFRLFVEDVKGRQADVEDFLLGEKNSRPGVLWGYLHCGCVRCCAARHSQRNPGCAQYG